MRISLCDYSCLPFFLSVYPSICIIFYLFTLISISSIIFFPFEHLKNIFILCLDSLYLKRMQGDNSPLWKLNIPLERYKSGYLPLRQIFASWKHKFDLHASQRLNYLLDYCESRYRLPIFIGNH